MTGLTMEELRSLGAFPCMGPTEQVVSNYLQIDTENLFNQKLPSPKSTAVSPQLADYKAALNLLMSQSKPLPS